MKEFSQKEIDERVAVLKRFKILLETQRNKFQEYLNVLEKQASSIETEDAESLKIHTEIENEVVNNIKNLQKVIVPMSELYNSSSREFFSSQSEEKSLDDLQKELSVLKEKVQNQNEKNRALLKVKMTKIKTQIDSFKNPYRNAKSVYTKQTASPSLVEINA